MNMQICECEDMQMIGICTSAYLHICTFLTRTLRPQQDQALLLF